MSTRIDKIEKDTIHMTIDPKPRNGKPVVTCPDCDECEKRDTCKLINSPPWRNK